MAQRKYSIDELDAMRKAIRYLYGAEDRVDRTEDMLRTFMLNGTALAELEEAARTKQEKERERVQQWKNQMMSAKVAAGLAY